MERGTRTNGSFLKCLGSFTLVGCVAWNSNSSHEPTFGLPVYP